MLFKFNRSSFPYKLCFLSWLVFTIILEEKTAKNKMEKTIKDGKIEIRINISMILKD